MVLKDQDTAQAFTFVGKTLFTASNSRLVFTDKQTQEEHEYTDVTVTNTTFKNSISHALPDLVEGHQYYLNVYKGPFTPSDPTYSTMVYCTNQDHGEGNYSINDSLYTERSTTNDFIVYE